MALRTNRQVIPKIDKAMIQKQGKEKYLSDEAMKALAPYKGLFEMFHRSKYVRYPGATALSLIHSVHAKETGHPLPFSTNCQQCMTRLFTELTPMYLDTIERDARTTIGEQMNETPKENAVRPRKSPSKGSGKKKA